MIIVNDKKDIMVMSDSLRSITVHTEGTKIIRNFKDRQTFQVPLGVYSNRNRSKQRLNMLVGRFRQELPVFEMPREEDLIETYHTNQKAYAKPNVTRQHGGAKY